MKDFKKLLANTFGDKPIQTFHYGITGDPEEADDGNNYSPQMQNLIGKSYSLAYGKKKGAAQKIKALIERYPDVPAFKNHLSVYYSLTGNIEKSYEINRQIVKEHPEYLFGKINLAYQYLREERFEEIPKIMGKAFDLKDLYPHRNMFHFSEYQGMTYLACRYYLAVGNTEAAESYLKVAKDVHKQTGLLSEGMLKDIEQLIHLQSMQTGLERFQKSREKMRTPADRGYDKSIQTDVAPEFHHPEIQALYENDLTIDPAILKDILALPRETLIEDLRKVLKDGIQRYEYFDAFINEMEEWDESVLGFPLHAMFLLAELRATETLADVLEFLRQGQDFLEFWLSDHLTESVSNIIYHLGQDQMDVLKSFMLERNLYTYSKSAVSDVAEMIVTKAPERRAEILDWYREIFQVFLANVDDDHLIDTEVISFLSTDCINLGATELLPELKMLWDKELLSEEMLGTWAEIEEDIRKEPLMKAHPRKTFDNIFDHYQHILKHWHGYMSDEEREAENARIKERMKTIEPELYKKLYGGTEEDEEGYFVRSDTYQREAPKVGRNEPCPCGSGKKYKKCCMNKESE